MYKPDPKSKIVLNSLKTLTRQAIRNVGSLDSAAYELRVSSSMLSLYGDKWRPAKFMPIDVLLAIEAEGQAMPPVTQFFADFHGYLLLPKPEMALKEVSFQTIGEVMKQFSEFVEVTGKSLGHDGKITADEIEKYNIEQEIQDVIDRLVGIKQTIGQIKEIGDE